MGLDILVVFDDESCYQLAMSEQLHTEIFNKSMKWQSFKQLRKIKDYYKSNVTFLGSEAAFLLIELGQIKNELIGNQTELVLINEILSSKPLKQLRITGD